ASTRVSGTSTSRRPTSATAVSSAGSSSRAWSRSEPATTREGPRAGGWPWAARRLSARSRACCVAGSPPRGEPPAWPVAAPSPRGSANPSQQRRSCSGIARHRFHRRPTPRRRRQRRIVGREAAEGHPYGKELAMLTVRDIMQTEVTTASPDMTVRELARLWEERGITGTPVVDVNGKVLGVVSASDLIRLAAEQGDVSDEVRQHEPVYPPEEGEEEGAEASWYAFFADEAPQLYTGLDGIVESVFEEVTVGDIMTRAIFSVRPHATIQELAKFLLRAGIRRALVMEGGKLAGIVTATDVIRAVAEGKVTVEPAESVVA